MASDGTAGSGASSYLDPAANPYPGPAGYPAADSPGGYPDPNAPGGYPTGGYPDPNAPGGYPDPNETDRGAEAQVAPKTDELHQDPKSRAPQANDIASVGVAIMPGVPLPDWVERHSLVDSLVATAAGLPPAPAPMATEFSMPAPPMPVVAAGGPLPPPDPAQRTEQPLGPVVWGPISPDTAAGGMIPMQSAAPAMESAAPAMAGAPVSPSGSDQPWFSGSPAPGATAMPGPVASGGQYGMLFDPGATSAPADGPSGYDRLPDYAPPPAWPTATSADAANTGQSAPYLRQAVPVDSAVPVPPPPQGFYIPEGAPGWTPTLVQDPSASRMSVPAMSPPSMPAPQPVPVDSAVPVPPPPQGFYIPEGAPGWTPRAS